MSMICCMGVRLFSTFGAERPLPHARHEVLDDLVVDVGLEERQAHFTQGLVEVLLGDGAAAAEAAEDAL